MTRIEQHRSGNGPSGDDRTGHGRVHRADPRHAGPRLGGPRPSGPRPDDRAADAPEQRPARSGGPKHAAGHESAPVPASGRAEDRPDGAALQVFPAVREPEPPAPAAVPAAPAAPPLTPPAPQEPAAPATATAPTGQAVAPTGPGRPSGGLGPWLDARAVQEARTEWERAQIAFVDDPAGSAATADELVGRTADLVAEAVRRRLTDLREECRTPDQEPGVRTEQLRLAMRDYRTVLDRLLG
ncbi:hypothetical protein [Kitasatospora sp. NPDC059327]|uniref:hypothetical protein n=1 Tax=Kitasatospora sp. NPDC059327 TaxID=3346803 RepID=UPI00368C1255